MSEISSHIVQSMKAERRLREAVFGEKRLSADIGHLATEATTTNLINIIETLCEEGEENGHPGGTYRWLHRDAESPLFLCVNPDPRGVYDYRQSEVERGLVAAYSVISNRKFYKPKSSPLGLYAVSESVFVEPDRGRAKVQKVIRPILLLGSGDEQSATKYATEAEIVGVIDVIIDATSQDDALRAAQNNPE